MLRKLIALALLAGGIAVALRKRADSSGGSAPAPEPYTPSQQPVGGPEQPAGSEQTADAGGDADDLAQVRAGQTEATIEAPIAGVGDDEQSAIPDVSDDDPLVREQEQAAAADAGSIGGDPDTVTADADPEMRPVVEGAGDAPETFETTDEQGR
ncbi:MAG TPA: hypothetical protein VF712_03865 [Thermoleophilaceae bacterium]|jgi:hypothetical protein